MSATTDYLAIQDPISVCSQVLMYALLLTFALGIMRCKVVALEMIVEVQLVFYSFATIPNFTPSFLGLSSMKFIGGFYVDNKLVNNNVPIPYQNLGLTSYFFDNFNLMIISLLLPLVVAGVLFATSKFVKTIMMNNKLQKIALQCICEVMLYFSIFNLTKVTISLLLNIQFYQEQIGSLISALLVFLMILTEVVLFIVYRNYYRQFNQQYQEDKKCRIQIYLLISKIFLCSIAISIDSKIQYSIYIILAIQLAFIVYSSIIRSYLALIHYIRQIVNTVISLIALMLIAYAGQSTKNSLTIPHNVNYLPIGILILLFIILFINLGLIIKHLYLIFFDCGAAENKNYEYQQEIVQTKSFKKIKKQLTLPLTEAKQVPKQGFNLTQYDAVKQDELRLMETLKQYSEYQSANRKKITLENIVPIRAQPQDENQMKKKLEDLNMNFL